MNSPSYAAMTSTSNRRDQVRGGRRPSRRSNDRREPKSSRGTATSRSRRTCCRCSSSTATRCRWGPDGLLFPAPAGSDTWPRRALQALARQEGRWAAGPALARPAAYRGRSGGSDRRHAGRADGSAGALIAGAAMRYQHVAQDRDTEIARKLSQFATSNSSIT